MGKPWPGEGWAFRAEGKKFDMSNFLWGEKHNYPLIVWASLERIVTYGLRRHIGLNPLKNRASFEPLNKRVQDEVFLSQSLNKQGITVRCNTQRQKPRTHGFNPLISRASL